METSYYGILLFLALVFLARWKRRRDALTRLNRGLNSYVSTKDEPETQP